MSFLNGVGVALVTPFDDSNQIDFDAFIRLLKHTKDVDYWVLSGTTGESSTTLMEEKIDMLSHLSKFQESMKNQDKNKVVLGIGGNNTQHLVNTIKNTDLTDVDAVLSVTPYYSRPNQNGMLKHFQVIADASPKPIILYNVPSRTGVNLEINTIIELSKHENIIGIKEADEDINKIDGLFNANINDFFITSGTDSLTHEFVKRNGAGVISVLANAIPNAFLDIIKNTKNENHKKAKEIHESISKMNELMYIEGNPTGIKSLLNHQNVCAKNTRLPIIPASNKLDEEIKKAYNQYLQNSLK